MRSTRCEVVALVERCLPLAVVARVQASQEQPVEAPQRAGRDHALGRAADAHACVDRGRLVGRKDRARDVAVEQELDPRPRGEDLLDQVRVARALEHGHRDVLRSLAAALRDPAQVLGDRGVELDDVGDVARHRELLHVDARARVEHRPPLGDRDDRDRVRQALGRQRRAVDGVDGQVDRRRGAGPDALAVVEHRRLVLLTLADDHDPVHLHRLQHRPHRVHGRLVHAFLVAPAHVASGGDRGRLRDAHELERKVAVGVAPELMLDGARSRLRRCLRHAAILTGPGCPVKLDRRTHRSGACCPVPRLRPRAAAGRARRARCAARAAAPRATRGPR